MGSYNKRALDPIVLVPEDLDFMNLPREFWRFKASDIRDEDVRKKIERCTAPGKIHDMADKGIGMLISGESGVGKTAIASVVAKEARKNNYTVYFQSVWDLRESVRSRIMFDEGTSILDRAKDVDFLVLDGLTEEDKDERMFLSLQEIERLVLHRGQRGRVTLVTTRIEAESLRKDPKLNKFFKGTAAYLYPVTVKSPSADARKTRKLEMKDIFGEDD